MANREQQIEQKINDILTGKYHQHRNPRRYRIKDDKVFKRCTQCDTFKLAKSEFYWMTHRRTWVSHCKPCHLANSCEERFGPNTAGEHVTVPWVKVRPFFTELVRRVGKAEASRRIGIDKSRVTFYMKTPPQKIFYRTAKKILQAVHEVRARNEIRHHKSIHHGSSARGHSERSVESFRDLYVRSEGDKDLQYKRERRRANSEITKRESEARQKRRINQRQGLTSVAA